MKSNHAQHPWWPEQGHEFVQISLLTPPRVVVHASIWQRDDEPDFVVLSVEARDGDGQLLAMSSWQARRTIEWGDACASLTRHIAGLFYDLNSPF